MTRDTQMAEDLLQETFLNAFKGLKNFSGASAFSTWLFRIATNNALMHLRKNNPERVEYDDDIAVTGVNPLVGLSPEFADSPEALLLSKEGRRKIEEAIESLPVLYRSAIVLRDVEGFSLAEVAQIMDSTVAAVKSRLHRARNAVRQELVIYYADRDLASSGAI